MRVGGDGAGASGRGSPTPGPGSAALGAGRRRERGARGARGRGREECDRVGARGAGARLAGTRAGSAETWSPSSRAEGARLWGTSQRWNPRNVGLQELLLQAREKSRTFNVVGLENILEGWRLRREDRINSPEQESQE